MKKACTALLIVIIILMLSAPAYAASGTISVSGTRDISEFGHDSAITINPGLTVELTNTTNTTYHNTAIVCGAGVTLTLNGVKIDDHLNNNVCPLSFTGSGNVLILEGESVLTAGDFRPGVKVESGASLEITGTGMLETTGGDGGAGIGGEFGGGVTMGYNADMQRLEIFGEENGACAKFNTSLQTCMSDLGMDKVPQQAVIVKFSASDISNGARVSFDALGEIDFWFGDDGVKFVDVANFFEMPITDFMPNNLELKDDTIYYFFFAFDAQGNIRMFIWEDGSAENKAYFEYDLYQDADDINNCDLIMHLAIGQNAQFNLYEYWVYTFDSFMDDSPFVQ